jgi:hypothetical protein
MSKFPSIGLGHILIQYDFITSAETLFSNKIVVTGHI